MPEQGAHIADLNFHPLAYLGLPVEDDREGVRVFPAGTVFLLALCAGFTARGLKSQEFLQTYAFDPIHPAAHYGVNWIFSGLLHGSWLHYAGNMYFLFMVGDNIEDKDGPQTLLFIFFLAVFAGHLGYLLTGSSIPSIGASGGVFGLLTYYVFRFPKNRLVMRVGSFPRTGWNLGLSLSGAWFLIFFLVLQLAEAAFQLAGFSEVNAIAHLGGAVAGGFIYFWSKGSE